MAWRWRLSLSLSAPTLVAELVRKYAIAGTRALSCLAMRRAIVSGSIGREPDAQLYAAVCRDVEAAWSGRQVQLPLHQQVAFRGGNNRITKNPAKLGPSAHVVTTPVTRKRESMQLRKAADDVGYAASPTAIGNLRT
jgi:hypothetical protein